MSKGWWKMHMRIRYKEIVYKVRKPLKSSCSFWAEKSVWWILCAFDSELLSRSLLSHCENLSGRVKTTTAEFVKPSSGSIKLEEKRFRNKSNPIGNVEKLGKLLDKYRVLEKYVTLKVDREREKLIERKTCQRRKSVEKFILQSPTMTII